MAVRLLCCTALKRTLQAAQASIALQPAVLIAAQPHTHTLQQLTLQHWAAGFSSSAASASASSALAETLKAELKHEKDNYEQLESVAKGPPAPFKLVMSAGDTLVHLERQYQDETVSVDCSVNMQEPNPYQEYEGEDEDAEESSDMVSFNVTVKKGTQALVFECASNGSFVDIRHVSLEPEGGLESDTMYSGPRYEELDEQLQQNFQVSDV